MWTACWIDGAAKFDYVIVDMPGTLVLWTETVLNAAQIYFVTLELDMRSAQNALRLKRALRSEDLPVEKLRFCLNRAPKFTDLNGKSPRQAHGREPRDQHRGAIARWRPRMVTQAGRSRQPAGRRPRPRTRCARKSPSWPSLHELGKTDADKAA